LLADPEQSGCAFIVLLDDDADALALSRLLERTCRQQEGVPALFKVPAVRGLAFFADAASQRELDAWWSQEVPRSAHPVYLVMDADGLEEWMQGLDGTFYVGVRDAARLAVYQADRRVRPFEWTGPLDFAVALMHDHSGARGGDHIIFDRADALRIAALSGRLPLQPEAEPSAAVPRQTARPDPHRPKAPQVRSAPSSTLPQAGPLSRAVLSQTGPAPGRDEAATFQRPSGGRHRLSTAALSTVFRSRRRFRPRPDADVAHQLAGRGTTLVVIGSRKGGVGKTSFAAGIAIVAGTVLDQIGHMACIVDANIANPDAWGQMNLPAGAATVRATLAALLGNREPPPPVHAATPALACYPEVREAIEYSRTAIRRLAEHLRRRYTLIVVDMSNRLPDPTAGPEAAVAAFWLEVADVLVLPTTSARADFNGALDYLEVGDLPPTVVAYIVPSLRRLRENPATLEYVRAVRGRAESLVEVPDEANAVRLAGMEGVPVEQLSARLHLAYRELTEVIAAMPRRFHG
jgi:MinD-like ATPase involved in chromosome partitioning or flagellar assembly